MSDPYRPSPVPQDASAQPSRVPLGIKLALICSALTVLVVGVALVSLRTAAVRDVRRVMLAELEESQEAWRALQEQRLTLLLSTSALVSTSPTLRAALATRRDEATAGGAPRAELVATIRRETERVFQDLDRDLLLVTDEKGQVLAGAARAGIRWQDVDISQLPAVRHALDDLSPTPDSSFGLARVGDQSIQVGCAAIVVAGYPTGVLVLGDRLQRVLPHSDQTNSALVVTIGTQVLPSDRPMADPAQLADRLRLPADAADPYPVTLGDDEYLVATLPLGLTDDDRMAAMHLLRSVSATLRPLDRTLTRSFLFTGLLAVVLVGLGAASAARSALGPLSRFVDFLRTGTRGPGDPGRAYTDDRAAVEVRTLIDAYNAQSSAILRQHAELARTNEDLRAQMFERERAEQALHESETALRQSQKLEALGRLAGGVAHDFNNLLQVIGTASHFLRTQLPEDQGVDQDLADIEGATRRATSLVRQLLAFSRKQVLQPQVVILNDVVVGLEPLLRRLGGPTVAIETSLAADLAPVKADPGQLEQVLMNVVVNACDAMPGGGTIRIQTGNVILERAYERRPEAIRGGPAVMLAVSDTGVGMDAETRTRIFEPFFTTKPPGKGTGLGLATVYGIVRQSGGSITVFSEPGVGTTFRIYLPVAGEDERPIQSQGGAQAAGGDETILLADDEEPVRRQIRRFLEGAGYRVLEASSGAEALEVAARHPGQIHLLISDLAMPGISGIELAFRLRLERTKLKAILLSGYSHEALTSDPSSGSWAIHLPKPVEPDLIARSLRELLDGHD